MKICPECKSQMEYLQSPDLKHEFNLFGYTIHIWDLNAKEWICLECATEETEKTYRREYEAGYQQGYEDAYDELSERMP